MPHSSWLADLSCQSTRMTSKLGELQHSSVRPQRHCCSPRGRASDAAFRPLSALLAKEASPEYLPLWRAKGAGAKWSDTGFAGLNRSGHVSKRSAKCRDSRQQAQAFLHHGATPGPIARSLASRRTTTPGRLHPHACPPAPAGDRTGDDAMIPIRVRSYRIARVLPPTPERDAVRACGCSSIEAAAAPA
jgi:hypothetical protein